MQNLFTKRNLIIGGIILAVLLITAIFLFGFKQTPKVVQQFFPGLFPKGGEVIPGGGPQQPLGQGERPPEQILREEGPRALPQWSLISLGDDPIASLVAFGTTTRYHKNTSDNLGRLFERHKATLDQETRISNLLLQQIADVVWSPKGDKAVVTYYDDAQNLRKFFIEYQSSSTPRTHFLDNTVANIAFSPDGKSLAYIVDLPDAHNIVVSDTNFKKTQKIFDNNIPDFELSWVATTTLALKTKSSYATEGFLYILSTKGGLLQKVVQGFGLDAVWNHNGSRILYSTSNISRRPQTLKRFDLATSQTQELPLLTFAEKCVFGKENSAIIYCAVPQSIPAGVFPDAWWQGKVSLKDSIVVIDTTSLRQIASIPTTSDVISPVIFDDDSYLFFRDKTTDKLWALKLKADSTGNLPQ